MNDTSRTSAGGAVDEVTLLDAMLEHRSYLQRIAYSFVRHTQDAEDIVQSSYLSAWSAIDGFRGQSAVKTWLTSIVINKCLTEVSARKRRTFVSIDGDPVCLAEVEWRYASFDLTPEQHVLRNESSRRVQARLAMLPEQTRRIVVERYFHERTLEDIAQEKGTTRSSVKGHLDRGCRALKKGVAVIPRANLGRMFGVQTATAAVM
jgi:RNA polymerase sigma-70 factor (ECF subfamily)